MKLVVVLVALLLLVWLLFGSTRRRERREQDPPSSSRGPAPTPPVEGMVMCAHCGVHLPASAALMARGKAYCSESHRDSGPRAP